MHRIYLIFFILFSSLFVAQRYEQPPAAVKVKLKDSAYIPTDSLLKIKPETNNITFPKNFRENFQNRYKGPEFDYTTVKPRESMWQKLKRKIRKLLESIFGEIDQTKTADYAEIIMRIFAVIVIGFVLYFLIRFLLGKDGNFFFSKKNKKIIIADTELHENIHEINFPKTISEFEQKKDFRSAIRYRFLWILKQLADKKLIEWNPEKTNRDYFAEIKSDSLKNHFGKLVYIFDYVWYGEFEIDEKSYQNFAGKFLNFKP